MPEAVFWRMLRTSRGVSQRPRLLCAAAGLEVEHLWSTSPGRYATNPPDLDHPEFLVLARRPA